MTNTEILDALISGETLTYGCHARNMAVVDFMASLEGQGLIETKDLGPSQETRRSAKWVGTKEAAR